MKNFLLVSTVFILPLIGSGSVLAQQPEQRPIAHILEAEAGKIIRFTPTENEEPLLAEENEELYFGDALRVERNGRVIIQCTEDASMWRIPSDEREWGVANFCASR